MIVEASPLSHTQQPVGEYKRSSPVTGPTGRSEAGCYSLLDSLLAKRSHPAKLLIKGKTRKSSGIGVSITSKTSGANNHKRRKPAILSMFSPLFLFE